MASEHDRTPTTLTGWSRYLITYHTGEAWAVWADENRMVQTCRRDGPDLWATPLGHMTEGDMRARGWIKADGSEGQ